MHELRRIACLLGGCLLLVSLAWGQPMTIDWSAVHGGPNYEEMNDLLPLADGGFIGVGHTGSEPGPAASLVQPAPTGAFYATDLIAVRYDAGGNLIWETRVGGNDFERIYGVAEDGNGDVILVGSSNSPPATAGDPNAKTSPNNGDEDFWLVKLSMDGALVYERSYGTSLWEVASDVEVLGNGNYLVAGTRGQGTTAGITQDWWVLEIDPATGDVVPGGENVYGGDHYDRVFCMERLRDGGVLVGGASASPATPSGGKSLGNFGNSDIWIIEFDADGEYVRDYQFGGIYTEQAFVMREYADGTVFAGGETFNRTGQVPARDPNATRSAEATFVAPGTPDEKDVYYLRFRRGGGEQLWDRVHGGALGDDLLGAVILNSGCVVLAGATFSDERRGMTPNAPIAGANDAWLWQVTPDGTVNWDVTHGGDQGDKIEELYRLATGELIIGGISASRPFDWKTQDRYGQELPGVPGFYANDMWFARLACDFEVDLGEDLTLCDRGRVDLVNLADPSPLGCTSWQWTDGDGTGLSTDPRISREVAATTTFILASVGPDGCERRDSVEVEVGSGPTITVEESIDPSCGEADGRIVVSAPGADSIVLSGGSQATLSAVAAASATFDELPGGLYEVRAVSGDASCATRTPVTLTSPGVGRTFDLAVDETSVCEGDTLVLTLPVAYDTLASYSVVAPDGLTVLCDDTQPGSCEGLTYVVGEGGEQVFAFTGETNAGCTVASSVSVQVSERATLTLDGAEDPNCVSGGLLSGSFSGGDVITLDGANAQRGGTFAYDNLPAGDYVLAVRTPNPSCRAERNVTLVDGEVLSVPQFDDVDLCFGELENLSAPIAVQDPTVTGYAWVDASRNDTLVDGADLEFDGDTVGVRSLELRVATDNGCVLRRPFLITTHLAPELTVTATDESCAGDNDGAISVVTDATRWRVDGREYAAGDSATGLVPDLYAVTALSTLERCNTSEEATIGAGEDFAIELGPDRVVSVGEPVTIELGLADASGFDIQWAGAQGLCEDCTTQTFAVDADLQLSVTVTGPGGCERSDDILIRARTDRRVYLPTAFSPNGDGLHETFGPFLPPFVESAGPLRVFDRWGTLVHTSTELAREPDAEDDGGWDGKYRGRELPGGVYTYMLAVRFRDGSERVFRGDVTLMR